MVMSCHGCLGGVAIVVMLLCQAVYITVVTSLSGCHVASSDVAPLVSMKGWEGCCVCLPGLGTTQLPSSSPLHCGRHSMVVVDGLCHQWWWWEGRSNDVAMFEPQLLHLGSHMPGVGYFGL